MKFTILALTTLLASALASPVTVTPAEGARLISRDSINDCKQSTYENETSDASPDVDDCKQLAENIKNGGTWSVTATGSQHQLAQYGTCAFGAQGANKNLNTAYIGNSDIIDVITASIDQFATDGKIGAKGTMECQSAKGDVATADMTWGIYHD